MKINKNSWHFRFNNFFFDSGIRHNNLCTYFWATVIHLMLIAGLLALFLIFVYGVVCLCIDDPWGMAIIISAIGCAVLPMIAIKLLRIKYPPEKSKTKIESLTVEYYKAFKGKYCPRIEYY